VNTFNYTKKFIHKMYSQVAVLSQFTAIHYCHETKKYKRTLYHTAIWCSRKQFNMKQLYDLLI